MTPGQSLLLQKLQPYKLKKAGPNKYKFLSPLREEENASAYLEFQRDNVLIYDQGHGEGSGDAILAKLGLTWPEVLPPRTEAPTIRPRIVAVYPYNEAPGVLRHDVVRFDPKDFRMRRPDEHGGHTWDCKGIERIPFMLPELVAAPRDLQRFIVEGEKDVLKLAGQGLIATTNPGGTGSTKLWDTKPFQEPFCDCNVVVLPDNDQAGAKHAAHVAASLASLARSIKVVNLPGLPPKGDVSDWLGAGHTVEELRALVAAAPLWTPQTSATATETPAELLPASRCLATVEPRPVKWLWLGRLASGEMVVLTGPPGVGKGLVLCYMVARFTTGRPMEGDRQACAAGNVLYVSVEDADDTALEHRTV
jgi:hypothetical protein